MKKIILVSLLLLTGLVPAAYNTDFEPPHPCMYMNAEDVARMKSNIKNHKWAWDLWLKLKGMAKADSPTGTHSYSSNMHNGRKLIRCATAYVIASDPNASGYGGATYDLAFANACAAKVINSFKAGSLGMDATYMSFLSTFGCAQALAAYDLIYTYLKKNRPADITWVRNEIDKWRFTVDMTEAKNIAIDNKTLMPFTPKFQQAIAQGDAAKLTTAINEFKALMDGPMNPTGILHEECADYNFFAFDIFVFGVEALYNIHKATNGQRGIDAWNWKTPLGNRFADWMIAWGATAMPDGWTAFYGNYSNYSTAKAMHTKSAIEYGYCRTKEPVLGWIIKNMVSNRAGYISTHNGQGDAFQALHHGLHITGSDLAGSQKSYLYRGDANTRTYGKQHGGWYSIKSGDPAGTQTTNTLVASSQFQRSVGGARSSPDLMVTMYGKGKKCAWNIRAVPDPSYTYYFFSTKDALNFSGVHGESQFNPTQGGETVFEEIRNPTFKIVSVDDKGRLITSGGQRPGSGLVMTTGVTDDYFIHCAAFQSTGVDMEYPIGGTNGVKSQPFADKSIQQIKTSVTRLIILSSDALTHGNHSLTLGRKSTKYFTREIVTSWSCTRVKWPGTTPLRTSIIEPLSGTSTITNVQKMATSGVKATAVKVTGTGYTDWFVLAHTTGTVTATVGSDKVTVNGNYGYIRKKNNNLSVVGDITTHNISGTTGVRSTPAVKTDMANDITVSTGRLSGCTVFSSPDGIDRLTIYDQTGTVVYKTIDAGHDLTWQPVKSGMFLYSIHTANKISCGKLAIIK